MIERATFPVILKRRKNEINPRMAKAGVGVPKTKGSGLLAIGGWKQVNCFALRFCSKLG